MNSSSEDLSRGASNPFPPGGSGDLTSHSIQNEHERRRSSPQPSETPFQDAPLQGRLSMVNRIEWNTFVIKLERLVEEQLLIKSNNNMILSVKFNDLYSITPREKQL